MKQFRLKVFSVVLVVALTLGVFPARANAMQAQTTVNRGNITVQGTNSLGTLISSEIENQQEQTLQMEQDYPVGYGVKDLTIDGNIATVEYVSLEKANLVVSLYTEDGLKMLTSGNTTVDPDETVVTVTLEGDIPDYFMASAYLLDTYDFSPLCASYSTPMYTREMQELLASTIDDYDADRVLNLDDDKTTNFAVYAETTKIIAYKEGVNEVISADDENYTYVIGNASDEILNLQTGDVFAYAYDDNNLLIVKVSETSINGKTVTIKGIEMEMEDAFSYVKLESHGDAADVVVDDSTAADGITFDGLIQEQVQPEVPRKFQGEGSFKNSLSYTANQKIKGEHDEAEAEISLKGTIGMELNIDFKYYVSSAVQFMVFDADVGMKFSVSVSGKVEVNIPLGDLSVMFFGVSIGFEPTVNIKVEGKIEISCFTGFTIGYLYDSKVGLLYRDTTPKVEFDAKVEASFFIGVDMNPKVDILKGVVAKAEIHAPIGFEVNAKLTGTIMGESADEGDTIHSCTTCVDFELNFKVELSAKITFLKCKDFTFKSKVKAIEAHINDYYWSIDNGEFGVGKCPHIKHRITFQVKDAKNKNVANATIFATFNGEEESTELGSTNANGILTVYLQPGVYTFTTILAEHQYGINKQIEAAQKILFQENKHSSSNTILDTIDPESIVDRGTAITSGECGDQGDNVIWKLYDNGTLVISGKGAMKDYQWDEETPWRSYSDAIQSVNITGGVTTIGTYTMAFLDNLASVSIANSVSDIGQFAFRDCSNLEAIVIPDNVTLIGSSAFDGCSSLLNIAIPDGVTNIRLGLFRNCSSLTSVTIPDSVTRIEDSAFYGCSSLTSITIPDSVTSLGNSVFLNCSNLTSATIGNGVSAIGKELFSWCTELESVTIGSGVTTIGEEAFYNCDSLASINIPDHVTILGKSAFAFCDNLELVDIGGGVTTIGEEAFYACSGLTSVEIPDSVIFIGNNAFSFCSELTGIWVSANNPAYCSDQWGVLYNKEKTFLIQAPKSISGDYLVSSKVSNIKEHAFLYNKELTGIWVDENNPAYSSDIYGVLFNRGKTTLIRAPGTISGDYTIPKSVTTIQNRAFLNCENLTSIIVPDNLVTIGEYAFSGCLNMTTAVIGDGTTTIGEGAFAEDYYLSSVVIGNGVTTIGDKAFLFCSRLNTITMGCSVTSIGWSAFFGCNSLADVYYNGTLEQWQAISIEAYSELTQATLHIAGETIAARNSHAQREDCVIVQDGAQSNITYSIRHGEYGTETNDEYTYKTASFSNLVPNEEYVLLALINVDLKNVLAPDNLLYIAQDVAEKDGTLVFTYVQRKSVEVSYVIACGASNKNLNDAVITLPTMTAGEEIQTVEPTVVYDGEVLRESVDYVIVGSAAYADAGEYVCYIRGINAYTGLVECTYTVTMEIPGDIDGDQSVTQDDAIYLLLHTMFGEVFYPLEHAPADIDQNGAVNQDDAVYLLLHTMFGETFYPLNTPA